MPAMSRYQDFSSVQATKGDRWEMPQAIWSPDEASAFFADFEKLIGSYQWLNGGTDKTESLIGQHIKRDHGKTANAPKVRPPTISESSDSSSETERGHAIETSESTKKCKWAGCNTPISTPTQLQDHIRVHYLSRHHGTSRAKITCLWENCGSQHSYKAIFNHLEAHCLRLACSICLTSFAQRGHLRSHYERRHPEAKCEALLVFHPSL